MQQGKGDGEWMCVEVGVGACDFEQCTQSRPTCAQAFGQTGLSEPFSYLREGHVRKICLCKEPKERAYLLCSKRS